MVIQPVCKLYLDTCIVNRPTDDQSQPRVREEAVSVARVFDFIAAGRAVWVATTALKTELQRNPDVERRNESLRLVSLAATMISEYFLSSACPLFRISRM